MCYNFQSARTGRCDVPVFEQHAAAEGGRHLFAYQGVSVLVFACRAAVKPLSQVGTLARQ